jgi:hypothetical protein
VHYLKREFERLVKYAQGLGVKVTFSRDKNSNNNAAWVVDGTEIIIYDKNSKSPLQLTLDMIHELSHHRAWIENGRKGNIRTHKILNKQDAGEELTENERKIIFLDEETDSKWQKVIHNEVGSKISLKRLEAEIELDLWIYKYYWLNNKWPLNKEIKEKKTALLRKLK